MANAQYVINNTTRTDTSTFTIPGDEDNGKGDDSVSVDTSNLNDNRDWYIHINNGWDVSVDVTARGSHYRDESMAASAADGSAVSIASGGTEFIDGSTGHSYIEVSVTPSAAPGSGDLTVTFQVREN